MSAQETNTFIEQELQQSPGFDKMFRFFLSPDALKDTMDKSGLKDAVA